MFSHSSAPANGVRGKGVKYNKCADADEGLGEVGQNASVVLFLLQLLVQDMIYEGLFWLAVK